MAALSTPLIFVFLLLSLLIMAVSHAPAPLTDFIVYIFPPCECAGKVLLIFRSA